MAKKSKDPVFRTTGTVAENRRARHDYAILQTFEAGIMLMGTEVKSMRLGGLSIVEAHAADKDGTLMLFNVNIPVYPAANRFNHEPKRPRVLLLRSKEMDKIYGSLKTEGTTLVPLSIYFNDRGVAKVQLGLAKGKKNVDRRQDIKERDWKRRKEKILRHTS
jgi:SsrA-binding protein